MPEAPATVAAAALAAMIPPARTALVVIDVQVDFAAPDGLIGRYGGDLATVGPAIDRIEGLIAAARAAGAPVVFVALVTRPETDNPALVRLMERRGMAGGEAICRAGDRGAEFHRVAPQPGDIVVEKTLYDAFHATDLDATLRGAGIETLLLTGLTTECCVDSTLRTAFHRGYDTFLVTDACAAYEPAMHDGAVQALAASYALLVTADAVAAAWARP